MNHNVIAMHCVPVGKKGRVKSLLTEGNIRRRLQDIGLVEGTMVECLQKSPAGDPIAYGIRGAAIALRCEDCAQVLIEMN